MHRFKEPPDKINKGGQNTLLNEQVPWGTEPALLLEPKCSIAQCRK